MYHLPFFNWLWGKKGLNFKNRNNVTPRHADSRSRSSRQQSAISLRETNGIKLNVVQTRSKRTLHSFHFKLCWQWSEDHTWQNVGCIWMSKSTTGFKLMPFPRCTGVLQRMLLTHCFTAALLYSFIGFTDCCIVSLNCSVLQWDCFIVALLQCSTALNVFSWTVNSEQCHV